MAQRVYPLDGLRVVDMTTIWAGPQLCAALADMGAEVIKVESWSGTDNARKNTEKSEFRLLLESQRHARGRRYYIALNLVEPGGRDMLFDILKTADVFVCNLSPRVMEKYRITYDFVRPVRPDIVMATISAAGHTGPAYDLLAFGPAVAPIAGSDSLVGYPDTGELMMSYWDPDPVMGVMGYYAVTLALAHREETGEGQFLDLAFTELLPDFIGEAFMEYEMTGRVPGPRGNGHPRMAPHQICPCSGEDTWISIAVGSEGEWRALCDAMGMPELAGDPRFADMARRLRHREELDAVIAEWTRQRTDYEAMETLQAAGVAAVPAFTIGELYHDPHDTHRRTHIPVETPDLPPELITYGIPWRLSETPGALRRLGRPVGADNVEFYTEVMGLPEPEVRRLMDQGTLR